MQYHLNGFKPGNMEVDERVREEHLAPPLVDLPKEVDVLIVGSGPAGLIAAAQLAAFPDIKTCIIERKPTPMMFGQADGIACRSLEIFEAFNFSERAVKEAYLLNETSFWEPDGNQPGKLTRKQRVPDPRVGLSEFPHIILNQARVHDFLLDKMRNSPTKLEVDYCRTLIDLKIEPVATENDSHSVYPVTATVERTDPEHSGQIETLKARYIIGCDGARSTVRHAMGRSLHGDSLNKAWGVMDVLVVTNFPDIRIKSVIHSESDGTLLIIPREGGYLVRLYIELQELEDGQRASSLNMTSNDLIAAAQKVISPFELDVKEVAWWSIYEIGQRHCDKFDDIQEKDMATHFPHAFICGDACHTHSPKAGQGMNVSMHDSFNLGWKLASVIRSQSHPKLLHTYSAERQTIAKMLIDFDRKLAKIISAKPSISTDSAEALSAGDLTEVEQYLVKQNGFMAGTAIQYTDSIICAKPTHQNLAKGLTIGQRFHSSQAVRLSDARRIHLAHTIKADGRWRLFIFANKQNPVDDSSAIQKLAKFLASSNESPIRKYTPEGSDIDSVIDTYFIFQQNRLDLSIETMPEIFWPPKGTYGLRDYEKIFCADLDNEDDIFDVRGIDRDSGCMVIARPDQHVAHVLPLQAHSELAAFFDEFMLPYSSIEA